MTEHEIIMSKLPRSKPVVQVLSRRGQQFMEMKKDIEQLKNSVHVLCETMQNLFAIDKIKHLQAECQKQKDILKQISITANEDNIWDGSQPDGHLLVAVLFKIQEIVAKAGGDDE